MCIPRATVSAVSCLVVPAFICIDLLISRVSKINKWNDDDELFCRLIEEQERQPDLWFRERCSDMWRENKLAVSEFLGSNPDNLVFVHNTTTGWQTKLDIVMYVWPIWSPTSSLLPPGCTAIRRLCWLLSSWVGCFVGWFVRLSVNI